ncbi:hypothetical protein ACFRCX_30245 [Streptomyces sp. NPDC056652]|uniref:hypothetical protein n=1 Tax=Streptomyces sp. NPDC056652 TaxID=3345893 RepID=UPI003683F4A8
MTFRSRYGDAYADFHGLPRDSELRRAIADKALEGGFPHPQDEDVANLAMNIVQPELDRLASALQRARDLHERREGDSNSAYCDVCANHGDIAWPCATIRALNGTEK